MEKCALTRPTAVSLLATGRFIGSGLCCGSHKKWYWSPLKLAHTSRILAVPLFIISDYLFIFSGIIFLNIFYYSPQFSLLPFLPLMKRQSSLFGIRDLCGLICHFPKICSLSSSALDVLLCRNLHPSSFLRPVPPNVLIFPMAAFCFHLSFLSLSLFPCLQTCSHARDVQPVACRLRAAQDGCECSPTQNHKFT